MKDTQNVNLISTPNIEGNVGSCTTKVERVLIQGGWWSNDGKQIATNSCTGHVDIYPYHEVAGAAVVLVLIGVFFVGFMLAAKIFE